MGNPGGFQRFSLFWTIMALAVIGWMLLAVSLVAPAHAQEPAATLIIHVQNVFCGSAIPWGRNLDG